MAALSRCARWPVSAALLFVTALACDPGAVSSPSGTSRPSGASPTVAAATTTPKSDRDAGVILEEFPPGGPRNEVGLKNSDKMRFKAILEPAGHIALDCPLSGTGAQAAVRDLVVYASGDKCAIARCAGLFADFAKQVFHWCLRVR